MQDTPQDRPKRPGLQRMVRKQLLLTPEQTARLKTLAATSARSEAEMVREALDAWLATQRAGEDDWKAGLMSVAGMWKDRTDLDEFYAARRKRRAERRDRINRRLRGQE